MSEWIKCSEALPEPGVTVVVAEAGKSFVTVARRTVYPRGHWYWAEEDWLEEPSTYTHWMPLPEPPHE